MRDDGSPGRTRTAGDSALADLSYASAHPASPAALPTAGWPAGLRLEAALPETGQGQVFRAVRDDGTRVAAKRMSAGSGRALVESQTLRQLRIDGVAEILDEQVVDGARWLITRWVEGHPFPGASTPMPWSMLHAPLRHLLTVLGRVHAQGYVHRDLKPSNVLVNGNGDVVVLDFGLSWAVDGPGITDAGRPLGTPAWLAPEQLFNDGTPRPATDLWAVGAMAFEALTGRRPFDGRSYRERARHRAPRLADRADVDAPPHVRRLIDALLALDPSSRPQSVHAVLHAIEHPDRPSAPMPWLGSRRIIDTLADHARAGRSARLVGPGGSGRTRTLEELALTLTAAGRRTVWLEATPTPLLGLEPALDAPIPSTLGLDDAEAWCLDRLRAALRAGHVVLVDDWDEVPASTRRVITTARGDGAVISAHASGPGEQLAPLSAADVRAWFRGPTPVLDIPVRASRALVRGTAGRPRLLVARLQSWLQSGLASPSGDGWTIQSARIAALAVTEPPLIVPGGDGPYGGVLAWVSLARGDLPWTALADAMDRPRWHAEAALGACAAADLIVWHDDRPHALRSGHLGEWSPQKRARAEARIANQLPSGRARTRHLLQAHDPRAPLASAELAEAALAGGRLETAAAACAAGLDCPPEPAIARRLLVLLTRIALEDGRRRIIAAAWQRLATAGHDNDALHACRVLLSYFAGSVDGTPPVSEADLAALELGQGPLAYFQVHALLALCERRGMLDDKATELIARANALGLAHGIEIRARVAYRQNRFTEAERDYLAAATAWSPPVRVVAALSRAASSALEAYAPERSAEHLARAVERVGGFENPHLQARLAWLAKAIAHRLRQPNPEEPALLEALEQVGVMPLTSLVLVAECGLAWQRGDHATMARLAKRAEVLFAERGLFEQVALMRAAQVAAGDTTIDAAALMKQAATCNIAGIGIQVAGLAANRTSARPAECRLKPMLKGIPPWGRSTPMDLISAAQALARLENSMAPYTCPSLNIASGTNSAGFPHAHPLLTDPIKPSDQGLRLQLTQRFGQNGNWHIVGEGIAWHGPLPQKYAVESEKGGNDGDYPDKLTHRVLWKIRVTASGTQKAFDWKRTRRITNMGEAGLLAWLEVSADDNGSHHFLRCRGVPLPSSPLDFLNELDEWITKSTLQSDYSLAPTLSRNGVATGAVMSTGKLEGSRGGDRVWEIWRPAASVTSPLAQEDGILDMVPSAASLSEDLDGAASCWMKSFNVTADPTDLTAGIYHILYTTSLLSRR